MDLSELLGLVFADVLLAQLFVPFQGQFVLTVINIFGSNALLQVMLIAIIAGVIAACVNRFLGMVVALAFKIDVSDDEDTKSRFSQLLYTLRNKYYYVLLFCAFPYVGSILTLLMGMAKISLKKLIYISFISNILYTGFYILY